MDYQLHISAIRTTWSSCEYEYIVYITETDSWWEREHQDYVKSKLKEFFGEARYFWSSSSQNGTYTHSYRCGKKHRINI